MVIWVKKSAINAACDQRAEIVKVSKDGVNVKIDIRLCGNGESRTISTHDVCGVELETNNPDLDFSLMFKTMWTSSTVHRSPG